MACAIENFAKKSASRSKNEEISLKKPKINFKNEKYALI